MSDAKTSEIEFFASQFLEWMSIQGIRGRPSGDFDKLCQILHVVADPLMAEIEELKARYQPGHTDMMVSPESLDAWLADNPLPEYPLMKLLADTREATLREAAEVASRAHLVPPDGGSPSAEECAVAEEAERAILALIYDGDQTEIEF